MIQALLFLAAPTQLGTSALDVPRTLTLDEPDLRLGASAWYFMPTGWLAITRGSQAGTSTHMVVGSDVDLDPGVAPVVEARFHGFGLRFARLDTAGTRTADNTFVYQGNVFDAGRRVEAEATFLLLEGDAQLGIDVVEGLRVTAHAGAQYWKYTGHVRTVDGGPPLDSHRAFDSAFWMAGADLSWRATPSLELRAMGVGAIQREHQNFFKVEADAIIHAAGGVAFSLGYRLHAIRFRQSTNLSNIKFHGPTLGVELEF